MRNCFWHSYHRIQQGAFKPSLAQTVCDEFLTTFQQLEARLIWQQLPPYVKQETKMLNCLCGA